MSGRAGPAGPSGRKRALAEGPAGPEDGGDAVLAAANLVAVHLRSARFETPEIPAGGAARPAAYWPTVRRNDFETHSGRGTLVIEWRLAAPAARRELSLDAAGTFLVLYDGLAGFPPEVARPLVEQLGRFASFPYFRAYVAQMAGMAGLRIPPLPILKGRIDRMFAFATSPSPATRGPGPAP